MFHGKRIGKFQVKTECADYDLDVRMDVRDNTFCILVPRDNATPLNQHRRETFEKFEGVLLADVKAEAEKFLKERDKAEFVDVIEFEWSGDSKQKYRDRGEGSLQFSFQVARVSTIRNPSGRPRLERSINVSNEGEITLQCDLQDKPYHPSTYTRWGKGLSMPFTVERWRKCREICAGIAKINSMMEELFKGNAGDIATRLDSLAGPLLLEGKK